MEVEAMGHNMEMEARRRNIDSRCFIKLVVPNFPPDIDTLISENFKSGYMCLRSRHFKVGNKDCFQVHLKSSFTDVFFPQSRTLNNTDGNEEIYLEISGRLSTFSKAAILEIGNFLRLYNNQPRISVFVDNSFRDPEDLEDIIRVYLLNEFCSQKLYESVDSLLMDLNTFIHNTFLQICKMGKTERNVNQSNIIVKRCRLFLKYKAEYWQKVYPSVQNSEMNRVNSEMWYTLLNSRNEETQTSEEDCPLM